MLNLELPQSFSDFSENIHLDQIRGFAIIAYAQVTF